MTPPAAAPLEIEAFDELDAILDDLRIRYDETPQWEFCEGFMAAVICMRRPVNEEEVLAALLKDQPTSQLWALGLSKAVIKPLSRVSMAGKAYPPFPLEAALLNLISRRT